MVLLKKGGDTMGKYLNGSAQTGSKIIKNWSLFSFSLISQDNEESKSIYRLMWNFDGQTGTINICVRTSDNKMSSSSLIDTDNKSSHRFSRPLGLYNDSSLEPVFSQMLSSIKVAANGIYSDSF